MAAKGLGSKAETSAKVRLRVWGEIARSDRGFEGNRRVQVAAVWPKAVVGAQQTGKKSRSSRRKRNDRGGRVATKSWKGAVGTWVKWPIGAFGSQQTGCLAVVGL